MKKRLLLISLLLFIGSLAVAAESAQAIQAAKPEIKFQVIAPLEQKTGEEELLVVPWVKPGDDSWAEGEPLTFPLMDENIEPKLREGIDKITSHLPEAWIWMGITNENILFKVVVFDDIHHNPLEKEKIWQCDSVQIGIDGRGNGTGVRPEDTILVEPDDIGTVFALTKDGAKGWMHYSFDREKRGALPPEMAVITRNEETQLTTYMITIPWQMLDITPGISPVMGVVVKVNDTDYDAIPDPDIKKYTRDIYQYTRKELFWGNGNRVAFRPGLFSLVQLDAPPNEFFASFVSRNKLWRDSDYGEIIFAYASDRPLKLSAQFNDLVEELTLPKAMLSDGIQRVAIKAYPQEFLPEAVTLKSQLSEVGKTTAEALLEKEVSIFSASAPITKVHQLMEGLAKTSPHPIFTRHLRSVDILVQAEWLRASTLFESEPEVAEFVLEQAEAIIDSVQNGDAGEWESYRGRRRQLVLTYRSKLDGTLQVYKLLLPKDWEEGKTYPLIVQLHGRGDPRPIYSSVEQFRKRFIPEVESFIEEDLQTFVFHPFGRGNHGYRGFSEYDVFEAMKDMTANFKTDPERTFLSGGSMGGMGTWAMATRNPDRWAAIELRAAAPRSAPVGIGLGGNLTGVPIHIWHGAKDFRVGIKGSYQIAEDLRRNGQDYIFKINPEGGHDAPREDRIEIYKWLLQPSHVRKRPKRFSYVTDTHNHYGRMGITMKRVPGISMLPRFDCEIEGNEVRINSVGTPEIKIDFSEEGLNLTGEVIVIWNNEEVYKGEATKLILEQKSTAKKASEYL